MSKFTRLPPELVARVASHLCPADQRRLAQTCTAFRRAYLHNAAAWMGPDGLNLQVFTLHSVNFACHRFEQHSPAPSCHPAPEDALPEGLNLAGLECMHVSAGLVPRTACRCDQCGGEYYGYTPGPWPYDAGSQVDLQYIHDLGISELDVSAYVSQLLARVLGRRDLDALRVLSLSVMCPWEGPPVLPKNLRHLELEIEHDVDLGCMATACPDLITLRVAPRHRPVVRWGHEQSEVPQPRVALASLPPGLEILSLATRVNGGHDAMVDDGYGNVAALLSDGGAGHAVTGLEVHTTAADLEAAVQLLPRLRRLSFTSRINGWVHGRGRLCDFDSFPDTSAFGHVAQQLTYLALHPAPAVRQPTTMYHGFKCARRLDLSGFTSLRQADLCVSLLPVLPPSLETLAWQFVNYAGADPEEVPDYGDAAFPEEDPVDAASVLSALVNLRRLDVDDNARPDAHAFLEALLRNSGVRGVFAGLECLTCRPDTMFKNDDDDPYARRTPTPTYALFLAAVGVPLNSFVYDPSPEYDCEFRRHLL